MAYLQAGISLLRASRASLLEIGAFYATFDQNSVTFVTFMTSRARIPSESEVPGRLIPSFCSIPSLSVLLRDSVTFARFRHFLVIPGFPGLNNVVFWARGKPGIRHFCHFCGKSGSEAPRYSGLRRAKEAKAVRIVTFCTFARFLHFRHFCPKPR